MTKKIIGLGITFILVFFAIGFAACELPDAGFAEYQAAAVSSLEEYVDALNEDDFNAENWTQIQNYLEDGIKAVNAATDRAEVRYARDAAKEAIGAVPSWDEFTFEYHIFRGIGQIMIVTDIKNTQQLNDYVATYYNHADHNAFFLVPYLEFLQENYTEDFFETHYILTFRLSGTSSCRFEVTEITANGIIYVTSRQGGLLDGIWRSFIIELPRAFILNSPRINFHGNLSL